MTLRHTLPVLAVAAAAAAAFVAGCGGGAFNNAPTIANPAGSGGRKLSFEYFQRCINPVFFTPLPAAGGNTCAGSGCHDSVNGTGGALRVIKSAAIVDSSDPANTPDVIRASDIYKNYFSALGETVIGVPTQSRLFAKPVLLNILHGGGQVFASTQDPNEVLIAYWINHPMPDGQDEFSSASNTLFTPTDPKTGACNTQ